MKNNSFLLILFLIVSANNLLGQALHSPPVPFKIGENVSTFSLNGMMNYPTQKLELNSFKGKMVILDFWEFWCTSCIASWPKLLKLQEKFGDKIQIVLVNTTENDSTKINQFVKKREKIYNYKLSLPMSNGDTNLKAMFPYQTVPTVVWIDQQGTLKKISGGQELNDVMIEAMLKGAGAVTAQKTDDHLIALYNKPLYIDGNGVGSRTETLALSSSILVPYDHEIIPSSLFGYYNGVTYGWMSNYTIRDMFRVLYGPGQDAFDNSLFLPRANLVFNLTDSAKLLPSNDGTKTNHYIMQTTFSKKVSIDNLKKRMITELEEVFDLQTKVETQVRKCLVISKRGKLTEYETGEKKTLVNGLKLEINKITLPEVINLFRQKLYGFSNLPYPIVDETGYAGQLGYITATDVNMNDFKIVAKVFEQHGLAISVQDRPVEVVSIKHSPATKP